MRSQDTSRRRRKIAGRIRNIWQGPVPAPIAAPEQQVSLLVPKLRPPRLSSSLVVRERLFTHLDGGLERKLIVLSAPAGSGKTTLISQWIARHQTSADNRQHLLPTAWVSLDSNDNDPLRFWHYVITASQAWRTDLGSSALALLHTAQAAWRPSLRESSLDLTLTSILNELSSLTGQGVLILEDYQTITSNRIHETLTSFIERLPPTLHLILITRSDPPMPLDRWRAQDQLIELQANDLCFTEDETITFLQQAIPFMLSGEELQRLLERAEGWGVGLRLLALALQGHKSEQEIESVLTTFSGNHRHLLTYFVAEVLDTQPEPWQRFLLQTSILSHLSGSLCDAVTECSESEQLLEKMERAGLFLLPLNGSDQWYRYHALFAEAMQHEARHRLGEDALQASTLRASRWYEQQGMLTEAIEAALTANEYTHAAILMGSMMEKPLYLNADTMSTLRGRVEQLPEQGLQEHPISLGNIYYATGALHKAAELYKQVLNEAGDDLLDRARALLGLARLSYEQNELEIAEQNAQETLNLSQQLLDEALQVQASLLLERIHVAREESQTISAQGHHLISSPLQEPLSEQELRVLGLLVAGCTRQEIANELVVSVNTVKTHIQRIYRKLNVTNHERACEVARNLHLL
jgi:ATP/maltotriose-dependent transcriptional regulator MalT